MVAGSGIKKKKKLDPKKILSGSHKILILNQNTFFLWLVGWSVGRPVGRLVGRSVGWSVGRSVGRLVGWLVGWLVRRFVGPLVYTLIHNTTQHNEDATNLGCVRAVSARTLTVLASSQSRRKRTLNYWHPHSPGKNAP